MLELKVTVWTTISLLFYRSDMVPKLIELNSL